MTEATPAPNADPAVASPTPGFRRAGLGLSGRLLLLTILFVMVAEVAIFVPSVAHYRLVWLSDRLAGARTAALVWTAAPDGSTPAELTRDLLASVNARAVALKTQDTRRLLAISGEVPNVDVHVDTRDVPPWTAIAEAFETLATERNRILRVVGPAPMDDGFIEIVIDEWPLRLAMLIYSRNILVLSLAISGITAALVYASLISLIVRPIRRLTVNMMAFRAHPEDVSRVIVPSGRADELGLAEHELAAMQRELQGTLHSKSRLAALGLAVSKINHDLRNMMASAHLLSDRLSAIDSPEVQRFTPMLIRALDRAIGFAESTLTYGAAQEKPPSRQMLPMAPLAEEVREAVGLCPAAPSAGGRPSSATWRSTPIRTTCSASWSIWRATACRRWSSARRTIPPAIRCDSPRGATARWCRSRCPHRSRPAAQGPRPPV